MTTFQEVCGTESGFLNNSEVISWAQQESNLAYIPVALILAQWIYEGAWDCKSIAVNCNNPGNANSGYFSNSSCITTYAAAECSYAPGYAGSDTGLNGALMNGDIYNAAYCEVSNMYFTASLTPGGLELYNYASQYGWDVLSNGMYNALYQLGDYTPVWATSKYTTNNLFGSESNPYPSTVSGSGLVYLIQVHGLQEYDYVFSG
ncbi:hypothetical protein [Alicyclobacillus tolerans]|uniref:Mannosyl-glycoprotein endo-beta-N-acetylglucosamidase-like domain-containing protein n=2 Tax=Alicyclobacillus TaxID=29330 RepID=A0ABT9LVK4_9BACL|nr:hypothetical protein [Alicyclobacillus tengchongensis]MDP9728300.1 hypothetical protein [Alicyclobacillus tengchongensis]